MHLKFGTDGWRAIIGDDYTVDNVARVSIATADWVLKNAKNPSVVIGYDCRFGGDMFAKTVAKVLVQKGVKVFLSDSYVSTPMVSLGVKELGASLGVVITASHNPASYNGFKLKGSFGGPLLPKNISEVEALIPDENIMSLDAIDLNKFEVEGALNMVDLETMYIEHVEANFDFKAMAESGLEFAYDGMYGAGQGAMRRLFPDGTFLHCDINPGFEGIAPEPILKNLQEFQQVIELSGNLDSGLATDGDADRIGLFDHEGIFVDSHHIILLLIHYMCKYKGMSGKVVTAFSVTDKVKKMCEIYGLEQETEKIGFKYIAGHFLEEDVLLGGEESGGIAIKGHIPERDGIWMGLVIWEFMAKSGKSLQELIDEVYELVGPFSFSRNDLHITEAQKVEAMRKCEAGEITAFGTDKVERLETIDGYKFFLSDDEWLMIRPSGTEPVLRTYCEAASMERVEELLAICEKQLLA
jgi:phosphomannomutase